MVTALYKQQASVHSHGALLVKQATVLRAACMVDNLLLDINSLIEPH